MNHDVVCSVEWAKEPTKPLKPRNSMEETVHYLPFTWKIYGTVKSDHNCQGALVLDSYMEFETGMATKDIRYLLLDGPEVLVSLTPEQSLALIARILDSVSTAVYGVWYWGVYKDS